MSTRKLRGKPQPLSIHAKRVAESNIVMLQVAKEMELIMYFILNNRLLNWLWERSLKRYAIGKGIPIPPKITLGDVMAKKES